MTDTLPSTKQEFRALLRVAGANAFHSGRGFHVQKFLDALTAAGLVIAPRDWTPEMIGELNKWAQCEGYLEEGIKAALAAIPWEKQP